MGAPDNTIIFALSRTHNEIRLAASEIASLWNICRCKRGEFHFTLDESGIFLTKTAGINIAKGNAIALMTNDFSYIISAFPFSNDVMNNLVIGHHVRESASFALLSFYKKCRRGNCHRSPIVYI